MEPFGTVTMLAVIVIPVHPLPYRRVTTTKRCNRSHHKRELFVYNAPSGE
jgi:hypothetical protein